jgi:hypothetical protein
MLLLVHASFFGRLIAAILIQTSYNVFAHQPPHTLRVHHFIRMAVITPPAPAAEDYDDEYLDGDAFQLPQASGGQGFDALDEDTSDQPEAQAPIDLLPATRGNNPGYFQDAVC